MRRKQQLNRKTAFTIREMMTAKHDSAVAHAAFRRGNAAGVHGQGKYGRRERRMARREEREALQSG